MGILCSFGKDETVLSKKATLLDYLKYLRSTTWKNKRKDLFLVRGRKCERCGSTKKIEVHHKTYKRLGNELLKDLEVLCQLCHAKHHNKKRKKEESFNQKKYYKPPICKVQPRNKKYYHKKVNGKTVAKIGTIPGDVLKAKTERIDRQSKVRNFK